MTGDKKDAKTTFNVNPDTTRPLYALAEEMGFTWAGRGNISDFLRYLIAQVELFGPRVVAQALAQENLAALAEAIEGEDDG